MDLSSDQICFYLATVSVRLNNESGSVILIEKSLEINNGFIVYNFKRIKNKKNHICRLKVLGSPNVVEK